MRHREPRRQPTAGSATDPMTVRIQGFGPIASGDVCLKPLTVFIGPNNSGKSYAAMLLNSLFAAHGPLWPSSRRPYRRASALETMVMEPSGPDLAKRLGKALEHAQPGDVAAIPPDLITAYVDEAFRRTYGARMTAELTRSFSARPCDLTSIHQDAFHLSLEPHGVCEPTNLSCADDSVSVDARPNVPLTVLCEMLASPGTAGIGYSTSPDGSQITVRVPGVGRELRHRIVVVDDMLRDLVSSRCENTCWYPLLRPCFYLPAARSGILQAHRALAAGIVETARYVGIEKHPEVPALSGVVADFISSILQLSPDHRGPFFAMAGDFERRLTQGEIRLDTAGLYVYPDIKYHFQGETIPLHRASSTVSEAAPLFLYLKYLVREDSVLIVEEPEAHLHPANQRILARLLVSLVRKGLRLIITTHSDYLLEQLGNFVMLSGVATDARADIHGYGRDEYLQPDEVGVHLFRRSGNGDHVIERVAVSEEEGIPLDEFVRVGEELYDEGVRIVRDRQKRSQ